VEVVEAQRLWDPQPGWLNTASYGLPPRPAWDALQAALADWRVGRVSWEPWDESTGRSRRRAASPPPRNVRTPQGRVVANGNPG